MEAELDISNILRPGVYILRRGERVAYIGKAKCLLVALGMHIAMRNRHMPDWFPIPHVQFDGVAIVPCALNAAAALLEKLIIAHRPTHNRTDIPRSVTAANFIRRNLETSQCPSP